jgi:hypothetical protein
MSPLTSRRDCGVGILTRLHTAIGLTLTKIYWLLGRRSRLSISNKLLLYKPIWTYGIELWGTASTSNIEILERF